MTRITRPASNTAAMPAVVPAKASLVSISSEDDSETSLAARDSLGAALTFQRRYEEAEATLQENLRIRDLRVKQGKSDPERICTLNNLAAVLGHTGRHDEAESMYRSALELYQTKLGGEHTDIIVISSNLAQNLRHQGKFEEAEKLLRQTIQTGQETLGPDAPEVLILQQNLGTLLHRQKRLEEAEQVLRQVVKARQIPIGKATHHRADDVDNDATSSSSTKIRPGELRDQRNAITSMNNLAGVLRDRRKNDEAETLYRQTLELCQTADDEVLTTSNLAKLLKGQGRYTESEALYRQALAVVKEMDVPDEPLTHPLMAEFGDLLIKNGKYKEAEEILRTAAAR